ncbi:MAG TPA: hypothetical protein VLT16_03475 [Candidatus Limnocylindrales bacterium]|nr:hypothetical protein [Candidatus Limnocylindrales bacterium]
MLRRALFLPAVALLAGSYALAQEPASKPPETKAADPDVLILKAPEPPPDQPQFKPELRAVDLQNRPKLDEGPKMQLIRLLDAEFVHTRKYFPLGDKSTVITPEGRVKPDDSKLWQMMQTSGAAAKIGDKVQITNISFKDKAIYVEINGGPKKKSKWYQHISVGIGGPGGSITPMDPNQAQPTGAALTLEFNKRVPEMTGEELQKLLSPVLDFAVKSAAEVYMETLPPKLRDAMKKHEVLVGMNKDMVVMTKDRPEQRIREKDDKGKEYEEWIYGKPPQDVVFVRFYGDEVTQVKTAKVGGQIVVKTQKEVDVRDGVATLAALQASTSPQDVKTQREQAAQAPVHRPTLRREGDEPDPSIRRAPAPNVQPEPNHGDEPQWGTDQKSGDQQSPQEQQRPPR